MAADARRPVQQLEDAGCRLSRPAWRSHGHRARAAARAAGLSLEHERSGLMNLWRWTTCTRPSARRCRNSTRKSSELDAMVQASRAVTHQLLGAIVLALVLALSLGVWLARPFNWNAPFAAWARTS